MNNYVLVKGKITSVEHFETVGNSRGLDEFTYEFEYDGVYYKGHSKEFTGMQWENTPEVGTPVEVYFYPDTQKWKRKRKIITYRDRDEYGTKVNVSKFMLESICVFLVGLALGFKGDSTLGFLVMGVGCILIGVSTFLNEYQFIVDRKNGKYIILHATVVDFKEERRSDEDAEVIEYRKVYEYIENGEAKHYVSLNGSSTRQHGEEAFLYKNISTQDIREEANMKRGIAVLIISCLMGIIIISVSILYYITEL